MRGAAEGGASPSRDLSTIPPSDSVVMTPTLSAADGGLGTEPGSAPAALERPGWEPRGSCRPGCGRPASRVQRPVARDGHAGRAVGRVCGGARGADAPGTAQSATDGMPHDNGHERRAAPVVAGGEGRRRARRGLHQVVLLIFSDNNLVNRFICFDRAHSQIIGSGRYGHGCSACGAGTVPRPMLSPLDQVVPCNGA